MFFVFFFFFQAEDGIRDLTVTGVQTCALPISLRTAGSFVGKRWTLGKIVHGVPAGTPRRIRTSGFFSSAATSAYDKSSAICASPVCSTAVRVVASGTNRQVISSRWAGPRWAAIDGGHA